MDITLLLCSFSTFVDHLIPPSWPSWTAQLLCGILRKLPDLIEEPEPLAEILGTTGLRN